MTDLPHTADWASRFWSKVLLAGPEISPDLGPCWVWTAGRFRCGYGQFWITPRSHEAHRASFYLYEGRWPDPQALHRCDNRLCVRRDHLFEGTALDNMRDMIAKGRKRVAKGEQCARSKLRAEQVKEMRHRAANGETLTSLAAVYGVCLGTVSAAVNLQTWRSI